MKIFQAVNYSVHFVESERVDYVNDDTVLEVSLCTDQKTICSYVVVGTRPTDCRFYVVSNNLIRPLIRNTNLR